MDINIAFMAKLGWRLLTNKDELWAKMLTSKYIRGSVVPDKIIRKRGVGFLL